MKKFIALLLVVLTLYSVFSFAVFAQEPVPCESSELPQIELNFTVYKNMPIESDNDCVHPTVQLCSGETFQLESNAPSTTYEVNKPDLISVNETGLLNVTAVDTMDSAVDREVKLTAKAPGYSDTEYWIYINRCNYHEDKADLKLYFLNINQQDGYRTLAGKKIKVLFDFKSEKEQYQNLPDEHSKNDYQYSDIMQNQSVSVFSSNEDVATVAFQRIKDRHIDAQSENYNYIKYLDIDCIRAGVTTITVATTNGFRESFKLYVQQNDPARKAIGIGEKFAPKYSDENPAFNRNNANISFSGKYVVGNKVGKATASLLYNGNRERIYFEVKNAPGKIVLNASNIVLLPNCTFDLNSSVPKGCASYSRKYTSDNTNIATVHPTNGLVSAKKTGTCTITVKTYNGKVAKCAVTVISQKDLITKIAPADPASKSINLALYQSRKLNIEVTPKGSKSHVSWSVADKKIASVSAQGVVTGLKTGKTTVTVAAIDGSSKSLTYTLTVTARKGSNSLNTKNCTVVNTNKTAYPYAQMCKDITSLKQKYPYIFDYVKLGTSYDNRGIFEIVIGNKNAKNKVFVQASIHAREYINSMLVMKQAETLCANYYTGTYRGRYYSEMLDNCCFYIIPMANPDGVNISIYGAKGINDKTLRSKVVGLCNKYGSGSSYYYTQWKANARGVDLNRNWDCNWNRGRNAINYACAEGYKGPSPASEKESKILKKEVERLKPKAVISYHSFGSVIYWDFIQSGSLQRKCSDLFRLTSNLTGYSSAENPSAYGYSPSILAPCFGDWVANVKKIPTLTIETGRVACPISASYFPGIWKENQHVLPAIAYYALNDTAVNVGSVIAARKGFVLSASKSSAKNFAYQIAYSTNSNFDNAKYVEFSASSGSLKISNLKANKKYYVCIRTVKKYGLIAFYGRWSSVKSCKTK